MMRAREGRGDKKYAQHTTHATHTHTHTLVLPTQSVWPPSLTLSEEIPNGKVPLRLMRSVGWVMEVGDLQKWERAKIFSMPCHAMSILTLFVSPSLSLSSRLVICIHLGSRL